MATTDEIGYAVTAESALRWVAKYQKVRKCGRDRFMVQERRSKGGWGVWDIEDQCWVYVDTLEE